MREKELRLALVCYGGISLAVYMHGITKEIWRLACASRAFHDGRFCTGSQDVYRQLLERVETHTGIRLTVFADIIAGASAGGINGIFLAQAITTGQSLDPLTDLWLSAADVEQLLDPDAKASRYSKLWALPLAMFVDRDGAAMESLDPGTRAEVRAKLSTFVRSRWFEPPFGGETFCHLLLDAFDAMASAPAGPVLLPETQPLDLFVTVTDFHGHPERLRLNSPPEVVETEHRLTFSFGARGPEPRNLGDAVELAFAARATASFPGAFPPFTVAEMDRVLAARGRDWPGRDGFLARALPRHAAAGMADKAVMIDGSVLSNAPFRPAIDALRNRPARREIDRRFVYVDPKPGIRSIRLGGTGAERPGFFTTILGALSEIPREQPIRDNLQAIEGRSSRIQRTRRVIESLQGEVEDAIEALFGRTFFLDSPTPARIAAWRSKAQATAAKQAGHAYSAYGHSKVAQIVDDLAQLAHGLTARGVGPTRTQARDAIWAELQARGLDRVGTRGGGASDRAIQFFREHDLGFRVRRLRFIARRLAALEDEGRCPQPIAEALQEAIYRILALYVDREMESFFPGEVAVLAQGIGTDAGAFLDAVGTLRGLRAIDDQADQLLSEALTRLARPERRFMLLAYLGFAFYDIATLSLMPDADSGEFDPIKVDRISPDDAVAIREGGAEATLKGLRFNSFGAFFSRAYRENDYLWGRLHGADRLIDLVLSTLPAGRALPPGTAATLKRELFHAILDEEAPRLGTARELIATLRAEIG
jgi:patatin-related protein